MAGTGWGWEGVRDTSASVIFFYYFFHFLYILNGAKNELLLIRYFFPPRNPPAIDFSGGTLYPLPPHSPVANIETSIYAGSPGFVRKVVVKSTRKVTTSQKHRSNHELKSGCERDLNTIFSLLRLWSNFQQNNNPYCSFVFGRLINTTRRLNSRRQKSHVLRTIFDVLHKT